MKKSYIKILIILLSINTLSNAQLSLFETIEKGGEEQSYFYSRAIDRNEKLGPGYFTLSGKLDTKQLKVIKENGKGIGFKVKASYSSSYREEHSLNSSRASTSLVGDPPKALVEKRDRTTRDLHYVALGNYIIGIAGFNERTGRFLMISSVYIRKKSPFTQVPKEILNKDLQKAYMTNSVKDFAQINFFSAIKAYLLGINYDQIETQQDVAARSFDNDDCLYFKWNEAKKTFSPTKGKIDFRIKADYKGRVSQIYIRIRACYPVSIACKGMEKRDKYSYHTF